MSVRACVTRVRDCVSVYVGGTTLCWVCPQCGHRPTREGPIRSQLALERTLVGLCLGGGSRFGTVCLSPVGLKNRYRITTDYILSVYYVEAGSVAEAAP